MKDSAINSLNDLEAALLARVAKRRPKPKLQGVDGPTPTERLLRAFDYYEFNTALPIVDQSERARALRDIARISTWYGWGNEITRALDREQVGAAGELSDAALRELLRRMKSLEDSAQCGCDPEDAPPAR